MTYIQWVFLKGFVSSVVGGGGCSRRQELGNKKVRSDKKLAIIGQKLRYLRKITDTSGRLY